LPDFGQDFRADIPGAETASIPQTAPPGAIDTFVTGLEYKLTQDFTSFLGLSPSPITSADEAQDILRNIERNTGAKPAFVYISFVPRGIDLAVQSSIAPADTDQLELVVVTKAKVTRQRLGDVTRARVVAAAQAFRSEVTNPRKTHTTSYLPAAQQLYQWLVAPIAPVLEADGITNLVFLPDAGLRSLPYAALHDGHQFLVEKYSVGLMPSLSLTDTRYVDIRNSELLGMGISESTQGQPPLPAVPVELSTVALNLWRGRVFFNDRVTLDNLRSLREQTPFGIIHLATHADFVAGAAGNSYIQLWNDKLRMDQIRQLGWNDPPVNLLVLSACRTALGNDQAELGFAGLALQTGVKTAVASLWYVSDAGTASLMTGFYKALNTASIKAEALRSAQINMITGKVYLEDGKLQGLGIPPVALPADSLQNSDRELSHPYYWAAFTMVGTPW